MWFSWCTLISTETPWQQRDRQTAEFGTQQKVEQHCVHSLVKRANQSIRCFLFFFLRFCVFAPQVGRHCGIKPFNRNINAGCRNIRLSSDEYRSKKGAAYLSVRSDIRRATTSRVIYSTYIKTSTHTDIFMYGTTSHPQQQARCNQPNGPRFDEPSGARVRCSLPSAVDWDCF